MLCDGTAFWNFGFVEFGHNGEGSGSRFPGLRGRIQGLGSRV